MPERYGVIGYPLGHSISPAFQQAALDALGLSAAYDAVETRPAELRDRIRETRNGEWDGLNVTIPHKTTIIELLDGLSEIATAAGAVNTVYREGGDLLGDNTDVPAITRVLDDAGVPKGARALVFGGGGAARAAILALGGRGHEMIVANRTLLNARKAIDAVAPGRGIESMALDDPALVETARGCGLIVNTTSMGMSGGPAPDSSPLPPGSVGPNHTVFDVVYRPENTPLLRQASAAGSQTIGGLEMLVFQGALSFELWTGMTAPVDVMMSAARAALQGNSTTPNFPIRRVFVVGLSGSGKSTVARTAARRLGWRLFDTDEAIVRQSGSPIEQIFKQHGEAEFRRRERQALLVAMQREHVLVATGGGMVLDKRNREDMLRSGLVVYIRADPASCARHIRNSKRGAKRPLLDGEGTVENRLRAQLRERRRLYETAHVALDGERERVGQLAEDFMRNLTRMGVTTSSVRR